MDRIFNRILALSNCSRRHALTILPHSNVFWVLVFKESWRNPTTFGFDKHPEDTGNGIIHGSGVQGNVVCMRRWYRKRRGGSHVAKERGEEMSIGSGFTTSFM